MTNNKHTPRPNARLIAAAPELFDFVQRIAAGKAYTQQEARDLIAKATGGGK